MMNTHPVSMQECRLRWLGWIAILAGLAGLARGQQDASPALVRRDPAGHGVLCRCGDKTVLIVTGSPEQMGAAHGLLLRDRVSKVLDRVLTSVEKEVKVDQPRKWFDGQVAEIERRTAPHIPPRFFAECDALSKAAGLSQHEGRAANLFPEQFHCSGVAVRGAATIGGKVLHARVLDYTCDADLQKLSCVVVFIPDGGYNAWMSLGFAGQVGTVTAMNEKGVAIGEKGNGGDGKWDGMPMTLLLRDVMERASTVEEAVDIIRKTPRTCDYCYVLSDKSGAMRAMRCTPDNMIVLEPGQQHPLLPRVPEDTVFVSMHAKELSQRLTEEFGKIDLSRMIDILKRPVASNSNLHNAIFAPETLDMWFADAGERTPACDEPYAHVNLKDLLAYYRTLDKP
jgi:hypothetical protein